MTRSARSVLRLAALAQRCTLPGPAGSSILSLEAAERSLAAPSYALFRPGRAFHGSGGAGEEAGPLAVSSSSSSGAVGARGSIDASWSDEEEEEDLGELTPREVVEQLDRHIVGQAEAKRAVANALRNRWRRRKIGSPMKEEIVPKNILMVGPTGCGKTEIARRVAKLANAPFVKVEATKFTEVGFHGRDVDQIIRDLLDNAVQLTRTRLRQRAARRIARAVEERIVDALCGPQCEARTKETFREQYRRGNLEDRRIAIDVPARPPSPSLVDAGGFQGAQQLIFQVRDAMAGGRRASEQRDLTVREARPLIEEAESERLENSEAVVREAIAATEQTGIVFIDEIDKIVSTGERYGADASSEGVQRDLLPIIEGSTVSTKHGNVATDHILFICSGAFHQCKPSNMLAELQGRLPVRVELQGLTAKDFYRILTEPEHNMVAQQQALMRAEGVTLTFTDEAVREVARVAEAVNRSVDNIGARRLYTILERIVEDISFEAPEKAKAAAAAGGPTVEYTIDKALVLARVGDLLKKQDLSKFIL